MSRAFIKEDDDQWLHDVAPTESALLAYLTRENSGITIHEKKRLIDPDGREIYVMSNGLSYAKNKENRWEVVGE